MKTTLDENLVEMIRAAIKEPTKVSELVDCFKERGETEWEIRRTMQYLVQRGNLSFDLQMRLIPAESSP